MAVYIRLRWYVNDLLSSKYDFYVTVLQVLLQSCLHNEAQFVLRSEPPISGPPLNVSSWPPNLTYYDQCLTTPVTLV